MGGFVKIDSDIFSSSIMEEKPVTILVWFFLLALADKSGRVDCTHQALARRFNLPLSQLKEAIHDLEQPDEISRSPAEDGRRIVRLDEHRDWGWQIVNYGLYRESRNADDRRAYKTRHMAAKRAEEAAKEKAKEEDSSCPRLSTAVHSCPRVDNVDRRGPMQKQSAEAEAEETKSAASPRVSFEIPAEWLNLGICKTEARALALLVEHPETVDVDGVRASHVTDEKTMRLERLHHLAELIAVSNITETDTSLQLWSSWCVKARVKAKPRLPAASTKDWRREVETLRALRGAPSHLERRHALTQGELKGWRGFEWDWVQGIGHSSNHEGTGRFREPYVPN